MLLRLPQAGGGGRLSALTEQFIKSHKEIEMELHRQQCQKCQSYNMRNIIVRGQGEPQKVYVRCIDCREFVALYTLSDYYHHGKGIDSYLRSQGAGSVESGREILDDFKQAQESAENGFIEVVQQLKEEGKDS